MNNAMTSLNELVYQAYADYATGNALLNIPWYTFSPPVNLYWALSPQQVYELRRMHDTVAYGEDILLINPNDVFSIILENEARFWELIESENVFSPNKLAIDAIKLAIIGEAILYATSLCDNQEEQDSDAGGELALLRTMLRDEACNLTTSLQENPLFTNVDDAGRFFLENVIEGSSAEIGLASYLVALRGLDNIMDRLTFSPRFLDALKGAHSELRENFISRFTTILTRIRYLELSEKAEEKHKTETA